MIKRYTPNYVARYRPQIAAQVSSTLARIGFCRTAAMGGRTYECQQCQTKVSLYNSCADRHCPQCSGARRGDWLDKAAELLLPGVTYFQVVFTLPDKLSPLMLGNRAVLYRVLMQTAYQSLQERIAAELGRQSAALLVLHILPKGFTKTRCYGGYSSRCRTGFIALCKQLCPPPPVEQVPEAAVATIAESDQDDLAPCCPRCQQPMQMVRSTRRPSWHDLFYGPDHQPWFERL